MAYTNPKPLLEEIAFARKQYERALEAGDTAAADSHFSRVMELKEGLANVEKANEQHNLRYGTQETIDDIRRKAAIRELRISLGDAPEASQAKPQVTGSGFRKPKGGPAPDFVPFDVLKANAEAAKAKLAAQAAEKSALGGAEEPKLATPKSAIDIIREAKEKKFGRVQPSNVPPKSTTANIIPRQEAIDEARALEEQARLKAIADREAFLIRQMEREASKKNKEEIKKNKDLLKEQKRAAAQGGVETAAEKDFWDKASRGEPLATGEMPERTPREIAAATPDDILGTYKPKLAQPAPEPIDTGASLRQAEMDAEAKALIERQKELKAIEAAERAELKAQDIAKKKASMIEYGGKPTHVSNLSTGELDRLLEEKGSLKPKDFGVRFNTTLKDTNEKHVAWKKHMAEKAALEAEVKARQERAAAEEAKPKQTTPKLSERQAEQQRIIQAAKDEAARRNAPREPVAPPAEQLGTPPPAQTAAPAEAQLSEKELRRQALMRQLAELDAPEPPKLAGATETVTTPEGLKITRPVVGNVEPAAPPSGLTPEQLQSLAEAEEFDRQSRQRPQQKGRVDNTPKTSGNPPRQTPPTGRPGFMAVPSLETMGNVANKTLQGVGLAGYAVGVAQHGPAEMAVSYGVPFTPWRYGVGPVDTAQAPERDPYAEARANDPEFGLSMIERARQAEIRRVMGGGEVPDNNSMTKQPEVKKPMPKTQDYSELFKNSDLFKLRQ